MKSGAACHSYVIQLWGGQWNEFEDQAGSLLWSGDISMSELAGRALRPISEDSFCQTKFVSLRRGRVSATRMASGRFEGKGKVSVPLAMSDE